MKKAGSIFARGRWWSIVPSYDELSTFLMALSLLIVVLGDGQLRHDIGRVFLAEFSHLNFPLAAVTFLFLSGLVLAIYHAFTRRKKTPGQKTKMVYFAVLTNVLAGLMAGAHLRHEVQGWFFIFPLWNVLSAVLLMVLYYGGIIDEETIPDEDVSPALAITGAVIVFIVYTICRSFDVYWAISFSICIFYATSLSRPMSMFLVWTGRRIKGEE